MDYYVSVFKGRRGITARHGKDRAPDKEGTLMFADFALNGQWFAAIVAARKPQLSSLQGSIVSSVRVTMNVRGHHAVG